MERDAARVRDGRPVVFGSLRERPGAPEVAAWVRSVLSEFRGAESSDVESLAWSPAARGPAARGSAARGPGPRAGRRDAMARRCTASAAVRAERDDAGRIRLTRLRSDGPYALRAAPDAVYLVGAAAGPLGGDELNLDIEVAAGAALTVRSTEQRAVPGRGESCTRVRRRSARSAPRPGLEPAIAAEGCLVPVRRPPVLASGAPSGGAGELGSAGTAKRRALGTARANVTVDGVPLLGTSSGCLSPPDPGGAVLGGARCAGSVLLAGPGPAGER